MGRIVLALSFLLSSAAFAQSVVSAQSGTIHYFEGRVLLDGQQIETKVGNFPQIKEKSVLKTEEGRAEVLLTPGVFLRVGEDSSVSMISNRLTDTRLELLAGEAVLEMSDASLMNAPKSAPITILINDATLTVSKKGVYILSTSGIKVYDGQLEVAANGQTVELKEGRMLALDGTLALEKFDTKVGDPLLRWTRRRAEYMSLASISAAKSARNLDGGWNSSAWLWNPYYGMFTFIPARGIYTSPFGFQYWSPFAVTRIYRPRPVFWNPAYANGPRWNGNTGYRTMPQAGGGYSGAAAGARPAPSAPSTSAAGAGAASVSRGGHGGGGRTR
jgi:hypothetical protein